MTVQTDIGEARKRLARMKEAVSGFDRQLATLERERDRAPKAERLRFGGRIAGLQADRSAAQELVNAAEHQLADHEAAHLGVVEQTLGRMTEISGACDDAARRFDLAMKDAAAALDELESHAATLASAGFLVKPGANYLRLADVQAAFAHAFADRFSRSMVDRKSMVERIALMMANARENASRSRRKAA